MIEKIGLLCIYNKSKGNRRRCSNLSLYRRYKKEMTETKDSALPGFESQADATVWIRWGAMGEDDDPEFTYLVKKGAVIIGTIKNINDSTTYPDKKILVLELDTGEEVRTMTPSRLQTQLGLSKNWKMKYVAEIGTRVAIKYLGINKEAEGKPHLFDCKFGKPLSPTTENKKEE